MLKPSKDAAVKAAITHTPQYTKLLRDLQKGDGKIQFAPEIRAQHERVARYVELYDNELKIGAALMLALLGEEEYHRLNAELENSTTDEQQEFLDEMTKDEHWQEVATSFQLPETPQEWDEARKHFQALPPEEQRKAEKSSAFFWSYLFSSFFNTLALMVHGEKLTTLVQKAIAGDDNAFMRAIQTDRMLIKHHPYFQERKARAEYEGDKNFLIRIASREANPILSGQIQYSGLYMVFGILESLQWLDDLTAREILDICIEAGLDQHQNRIDDVSYLRQQLNKYRKWQKTQRMSRI